MRNNTTARKKVQLTTLVKTVPRAIRAVKQEKKVFIHEEDIIANTPDTTDHLIKLRIYGPLRTGSMNTQVQAVHRQTATRTLRFGARPRNIFHPDI